jgi:hypothetical protein
MELAHHEGLVAPAADRLAHDFLRAALAVHLGGVEEGHAEVEPETHGRDLGLALRRVLAHVPRSHAQPRHLGAVGQAAVRYRR